MKKEMVLYEKSKDNINIFRVGCFTSIIMLVMVIFDSFFMQGRYDVILIPMTIFLSIVGSLFTIVLQMIFKNKPKELLSITENGFHHHFRDFKIPWDKISEIQIIDNVVSVTVDSEPGKDFKLALKDTDFSERRMTIDDFAKFINCYYKKDIYTYNSPSYCGCC